MSEELIIKQCSPTLAGIKTANLFSAYFESKKEMYDKIRELNKRLRNKGLLVLPLKYESNRGLIYFYRPKYLKKDINCILAKRILDLYGYDVNDTNKCIIHLIERIGKSDKFPHEIGLFLGYPPEDVKGFIDNKAKNFKAVGTWKVYGNEKQAKITFNKFKKCTDVYYKQWQSGKMIERLTVAV